MAAARQVTIVGSDVDGYTWVCGHCPMSAATPAPTRDAALLAFDDHYVTAVSAPNLGWQDAVFSAGQQLAATAADASAWTQAMAMVPPGVVAAWQSPGNIHPV